MSTFATIEIDARRLAAEVKRLAAIGVSVKHKRRTATGWLVTFAIPDNVGFGSPN